MPCHGLVNHQKNHITAVLERRDCVDDTRVTTISSFNWDNATKPLVILMVMGSLFKWNIDDAVED